MYCSKKSVERKPRTTLAVLLPAVKIVVFNLLVVQKIKTLTCGKNHKLYTVQYR